jgi:opacity protein-like surface antigen
MMRTTFACFLLAAAAAASAQQSEFSYSYVSGAYSQADYDGFSGDADALGLGISLEISPDFHLFGSYTSTDLGSNADASTLQAGVGYHTPISPVIDVVAEFFYVTTEFDLGPASIDDDGFGLGVGIRALATPRLEVDAGVSYVDTDSGNDTALNAGFLYNATQNLAIGLGGSWDDDVSVWSLNGRVYFE